MKKLLFIRGGFHKEFAYKTFLSSGNEMIMMDVPESMQISLADYQYLIPDINNQEEMYHVAKKIYDEIGFDGVVTFMNSPIPVVGKLSDELGFDYFTENTGGVLSNKYDFRKLLSKINKTNIAYSQIFALKDVIDFSCDNGFPFVLKPTDTASSRGVSIIYNKDQIEDAFNMAMKCSINKMLIAEEYINGEEHCAEILVVKGKAFVLGVSKKIIDDETNTIELMDITPAPKYDEIYPKITTIMQEVVETLEIHNWLLHVEFKYLDGNIEIIELNPRAAGANLLESEWHLKGINPYELLFKVALKEEIDCAELNIQIGKEYSSCTVFYSFISPKKEGIIEEIEGITELNEALRPRERFNLFYKKGDAISVPTSNNDFRGTMYLFGENYNEVIARAYEYESMLEYSITNLKEE